MIFRQLFDAETFTYTYLLAGKPGGEAVLIDPVNTHIDRYIELLGNLALTLKFSLETHVHADHITASGMLRQRLGAQTGVSQACGAAYADRQLRDGDVLSFGDGERLEVIATPGHTPGSVSFYWRERVFTGDALLINGCGRTDFQGGDAGALYDSITGRLFTLPDETLVYPGHDYNGRWVSNIIQARGSNARLAGKTRAQFIDIMNGLDLPKPRMIEQAVPANRLCGLPEEELCQASGRQQPPDRVAEAKRQITEINVQDAAVRMQAGGVMVIDVREPDEYAAGHLPHAVNIPRGVLEFELKSIPSLTDKSLSAILYCRSGGRSALATLALQNRGYTNVVSLAGGYEAWQAKAPGADRSGTAQGATCG